MRSLTSDFPGTIQIYPAHPKLRFYGYNARELAGSSAQIIILHGAVPIATINLAAKESTNDWPDPGGIATPNGLSIQRVVGKSQVGVYFRS